MESKAQRRYMHAAAKRGDIAQGVVDKFERATPKGMRLPARKKKAIRRVLKGRR